MIVSTATAFAADGGYLFVTFKGEQSPMTEQIYFALSKDGRQWTALNGGEPVLISKLGEKGVRDPYLLRSHDGKKFYILATDLSIHLNRDWGRAQTSGSKSIVIWESDDLVRWSSPRLVQVAAPDAGCTWAPEAVYDEETKDYLVFWASKNRQRQVRQAADLGRPDQGFPDTFAKPFIYIDKPDHVIDTDIVREGGQILPLLEGRANQGDHDGSQRQADGTVAGRAAVFAGAIAGLRRSGVLPAQARRRRQTRRPGAWCWISTAREKATSRS